MQQSVEIRGNVVTFKAHQAGGIGAYVNSGSGSMGGTFDTKSAGSALTAAGHRPL